MESGDTTFGSRPIEGFAMRRKITQTRDFQQVGDRYRSLSEQDRDHLIDNIVDSLGHADKANQRRMVENLTRADSDLGASVAEGLKH